MPLNGSPKRSSFPATTTTPLRARHRAQRTPRQARGRQMAEPARSRDYRPAVERLVKYLSEAEGDLQSLADNELDAIVDPASTAPILLSRAQNAITRSEARYRDLVHRCPALV